mgnify:CR=1 FL=1
MRSTWRPANAVGTGLIFCKFLADRPAAYGPEVTSRDVAVELDWYLDWKVNKNFTLSFVGAFADPGALVEQANNRTKNFAYWHGLTWFTAIERPRPPRPVLAGADESLLLHPAAAAADQLL